MRPETSQVLERLQSTEWFANVGKPFEGADVSRVYSWKDALAPGLWSHWGELLLEVGHNDLSVQVPDTRDQWNKAVDQIRPKVDKISEEKTAAVCAKHELPKRFVDRVRWCVLHALLEAEFRRYVKMNFNTDLISWYLKGHYPCGWEGKYPTGRLIVF